MPQPDLIVVGAGIIGMAHALAAARRGRRVLVIDRDAQANGASIRNFGFVTVTGQERGAVWQLARRTADIWREIAPEAGITIEQNGLLLVAQRPEAAAVIEAFLATEMGTGCHRVSAARMSADWPMVRRGCDTLWSPHDLRVESALAIPRLARFLAERHGVDFCPGTTVLGVETGAVHTSRGPFRAENIVLCPGDDGTALYPDLYAEAGITRCKLQMLRLAAPGWRLPSPVMSDLSMVRYPGYAALPQAQALRERLEREEAVALTAGVHLIAVQGGDGTLVVGDSHHYAATPDPFASEAIDRVILDAYAQVLGDPPEVVARWTGTYASGTDHHVIAAPADRVHLVVVTSGTGASTGFALAEQVIDQIFGGEE